VSKKWYNLFVSVESPAGSAEPAEDATPPPADAARLVSEIAASIPAAPTFTAPVADPTSFAEVYRAAEVPCPAHGYTIEKVANMLQSEHLRGLSAEVRRSSILVALEASGAKIEEVIQDAVRRDRALDGYERVLQKSLDEVQSRKSEENRRIEAEMNKMLAEYRARIQANNEAITKEKESFSRWQARKQQEERNIAEAVSYFVSENPVTVSGAGKDAPAGPKASGS